uniref:Uncharacterized protein n=1 Tax=Maylandia zebra TaxID=106582 RepID=A0A3P9CF10_9CICH
VSGLSCYNKTLLMLPERFTDSTPSSDGPLPSPEPFSGETEKCPGFLAQCSLIFREQRRFHNNDGAKIAFLV